MKQLSTILILLSATMFLIGGIMAQEQSETGEDYNITVEVENQSSSNTSDRVNNVNHTESGIEFTGTIWAPTPCHTLEHQTEKLGDNTYRINIDTYDNLNSNEACAGVTTGIDYNLEFNAEQEGFELEIWHGEEQIESIIHENQSDDRNTDNGQETQEPEESALNRLLRFLGLR